MTAIDDMQAGAEMDWLIAERVMGWTFTEYGGSLRGLSSGRMISASRSEHREGGRVITFHPSENIDHAWEVIERLRSLGEPCVYVLAPEDREVFGTWGAMVSHEVTADAIGGIGYGATAPLAICRAALKAVDSGAHPE